MGYNGGLLRQVSLTLLPPDHAAIDMYDYDDTAGLSDDSGDVSAAIQPIDNKIEKAMDLVKSHLLLAVREEVDVLNANISQLVERIGRLERENAQLRNFVPAEVLARVDNKHPSARGVSRQ